MSVTDTNSHHMCVHVCVCMCVRVWAREGVCMGERASVTVCACVSICV
jgi:hypothetical protein